MLGIFVQFLLHLLTTVSSNRTIPFDAAEQVGQAEEEDTSERPEESLKASHRPKRRNFNSSMPPLRLPPSSKQLTMRDQRLLDHISNFYLPLISNISPKFVLWTRGIQK
jgi:hypothetical protein